MGDKPLTELLTEIKPVHWDMILRRMRKGRCVPFLGAAVNVRSRDESYPYKGLPLAEKVALDFVRTLMKLKATRFRGFPEITSHVPFENSRREDLLRLTLHNLARVALHVDVDSNFDFDYLLSLLQESLSGENTPSKLLETIARIETLQLIVTTNYDRLMENALEKIHRPYELVVQPIDGFKDAAQDWVIKELPRVRDKAKLILYKIHGTFPDAATPKTSRIIITEDDYIKFLTVIGAKDKGVPPVIRSDMVDGTLLFLGYSLEDWDFRTIYKGLIEELPPDDRRTSFAIQKDPPRFWVEYWKSKGVVICDMDVYQFADELKKRCQDEGLYHEECGTEAERE